MWKPSEKKHRLKDHGMTDTEYTTKYRPFIHENCPCVVCCKPAASHHITHKSISGKRRRHDSVIALCYDHHQGANGIHVLNEAWYDRFISLDDLLRLSAGQLERYKESRCE